MRSRHPVNSSDPTWPSLAMRQVAIASKGMWKAEDLRQRSSAWRKRKGGTSQILSRKAVRSTSGVFCVLACVRKLTACATSVVLWSLDDYWYYSLFTLVMLVVFECTVVNSRLRHADEMRSYSAPPSRCHAFRRGRWRTLEV